MINITNLKGNINRVKGIPGSEDAFFNCTNLSANYKERELLDSQNDRIHSFMNYVIDYVCNNLKFFRVKIDQLIVN